jgi:acetyl esterase/lipase
MRPNDPRYKSIPLPSGEDISAELTYFIGASPVLDSYGRYLYAKEAGEERLMAGSLAYFGDEDTMKEGSPQVILDRNERVTMPPTLIIHGTSDGNVPNYIPENFTKSYREAGGDIKLELFENMYHSFVKDASPKTDQATVMMQDFMAKHLST